MSAEMPEREAGLRVFTTNLLLCGCGVPLLALYVQGVRTSVIPRLLTLLVIQAVLYLPASWAALRSRPALSTRVLIVGFAAFFRLTMLFSPPHLSDDIYRYVWDGRVQAAGINPYRYIPADPALAALRDDRVYPKINRREYAHTIYPPLDQMIYFAVTRVRETVSAMKVAMVAFEAMTVFLLAALLRRLELPAERLLLYLWHPLAVWEIAGSGLVDVVALACIAGALLAHQRNARTTVGIALGCAALVKLYPVVLLPAFYRRWEWKMPVACALTIALAYLPYLGAGLAVVGFLPQYTAEEGLLSGDRFFLLNMIHRSIGAPVLSSSAYVAGALMALGGLAIWAVSSRFDDPRAAIGRTLMLAVAFHVLLSPRYAWYFLWFLPFLAFAPRPSLVYLTLSAFALYGSWIDDSGRTMLLISAGQYLPFFLIAAMETINMGRGRVNIGT